MIYELLYPLRHSASWLGWLNVLRYVPFRVIASTMTSMMLCFALSPWFIRELQKKQIGEVGREAGMIPDGHIKKRGTPTMGGALLLLAVLGSTILWCDLRNVFVLAGCAITAGYGVIGYLDDYLKIRAKNSKGLAARYKLLGQFLVAGAVLTWVFTSKEHLPPDFWEIRDRLAIPFVAFNKHPIHLPLALYIVFAVVTVVAMSNAVNFTDGLDGLAIGPVIFNAGTYLIWAYLSGATFGLVGVVQRFVVAKYLDIPFIASSGELAVFCGAMVGAGIGFLWYNTYPAQVFMGDVGALALGGGLGTCAVFTKNELLSVILGGIFFLEGLSVVTQVVSFKLTGKRVFLMAPIHHHYEKKGWPEPKIIVRFWIISILLALVSLSSLKLR
jgi:phospho-N-acetylmuramoyl-pentapeptide-transferase